jgi:chromosome partitioning protein
MFHVEHFHSPGRYGTACADLSGVVGMGRVICIANQKGGVGKTTTAVNLGAALAVEGRSTLLLDIDPQANATSGAGVRADEIPFTVYDVLLGERGLDDIVRPSAVDGLYVAPANRDLVGAEIDLVTMPSREFRIRDVLAPAKHRYPFILIDCPPSLSLLTINGLTAADSVLIPLQCEYYALEGLAALIDTIGRVREHFNPSLQIEGILLTMFDSRNSLAHQVAREIREHFDHQVFQTVIPRNVRLSECPSHGLPIVMYDPRSKGAAMYSELAGELLRGAVSRESEVGL